MGSVCGSVLLVVAIVLAICFFRKPKVVVESEKPDSPVLKSALKKNKKEEPKDKYNYSDNEEAVVKAETKQAKKLPAKKQYGFSDDEEQIYFKTETKKEKKFSPQKLEMEEHSNSEKEEAKKTQRKQD